MEQVCMPVAHLYIYGIGFVLVSLLAMSMLIKSIISHMRRQRAKAKQVLPGVAKRLE